MWLALIDISKAWALSRRAYVCEARRIMEAFYLNTKNVLRWLSFRLGYDVSFFATVLCLVTRFTDASFHMSAIAACFTDGPKAEQQTACRGQAHMAIRTA